VIAMGDCYMATVWTMLVLMFGVLDASINSAFVPMVFVLVVQMPIVHVIEMIVMGNDSMPAIWTMNVGMLVLHLEIMPQDRSFRWKSISQFSLENLP
jgi:hypothetical protein